MKKRLALAVAAIAMSLASIPAPASAGQYCEAADGAGLGGVCRGAGEVVVKVCTKAGVDCTLD